MARLAAMLLAEALLFWSAETLRLLGEAEDAEGEEWEMEQNRQAHLPTLEQFSNLWRTRYALEWHLQEPMSPSVQLVLGVFTVPGETAYREVIRSTWLAQTGVCYLQNPPLPNCSVHVAFVLGQARDDDEEFRRAKQEPGFLVLSVAENMDHGKSPAWMGYAVENFPWATHYGKIDSDTYPFLHKLVARIGANRSCVQEGSDFEWIGRPVTLNNAPVFSEACTYRECQGRFHTAALDEVGQLQPFQMLAGELYILSRPLAAAVPWFPQRGLEDMVMRRFVADAGRRHGKCVVVRELAAHAHLARWKYWGAVEAAGVISEAFANDF